jgi:hypothetical protein
VTVPAAKSRRATTPRKPSSKTPARRTTAKSPAWAQAQRDSRIIKDRLRHLSTELTAKKHKVSERTVERVMETWRDHNRQKVFAGQDPLVLVNEQLGMLEAEMESLAEIVEGGESDSVKVQAIVAKLGVIRATQNLRQTTGLLPHDLGTLRVIVDQRRTVDFIFNLFKKYDLPDEALHELIDNMPEG